MKTELTFRVITDLHLSTDSEGFTQKPKHEGVSVALEMSKNVERKYYFDSDAIVENCYPNAGQFNSISDEHDNMAFDETDVSEIRFSERPRYGLNGGVSKHPQYEWLDKESEKRDNRKKVIVVGTGASREIHERLAREMKVAVVSHGKGLEAAHIAADDIGTGLMYTREAIEHVHMISRIADYHRYPPVPRVLIGKKCVPVRNSKTDPKVQRNDPCPCRSGKKYKQCCIKKQAQ